VIELENDFLNVGNDEHRPTRLEERRFDDKLIKCRLIRLRLPEDQQKRAARAASSNLPTAALAAFSFSMR
jgi:hypothetical protein